MHRRAAGRVVATLAALVAAGLFAAAGFAIVDRPTVVVVGDSITAQYGPPLAQLLRRDGYRVDLHGYPGLGLLDRGPRLDINPLLDANLASAKPDLVVGEFSGNYGLANPPAPAVPPGSPAFYAAWTQAVRAFAANVRRRGARLVWIIPPRPLKDASTAEALARIYAGEAGSGIDVLDTGPPVAAREVNGNLHEADGAHLSPEGATFVAGLVARRVRQSSTWPVRLRTARGTVLILELVVGCVLLLAAVALVAAQR